jgi:hypothetical protein
VSLSVLMLSLPMPAGSVSPELTPASPEPESSDSARATDQLVLQLKELEARLAILKAEYTDRHPDVIQLRQEIADLRTQLKEKRTAAPPHRGVAKHLLPSDPGPLATEAQRLRREASALSPQGSASLEEEKAELVETARLLAMLLHSGRVVIRRAQATINTPNLEDKGFSSAVFESQLRNEFQTRTGHDLRNLTAAEMPERAKPLLVRLAFFMQQTVQEAQPLINQKGIGFKGFIPATFATRVAEKFSADTGLSLRHIGPPGVPPRNPNNRPTDQEERALSIIQKSGPRIRNHVVEQQIGNQAVGILLPLFYIKQCLACHGSPKGEIDISGYEKEGFKEGDLGGAISVMLPVDYDLLKAERDRR